MVRPDRRVCWVSHHHTRVVPDRVLSSDHTQCSESEKMRMIGYYFPPMLEPGVVHSEPCNRVEPPCTFILFLRKCNLSVRTADSNFEETNHYHKPGNLNSALAVFLVRGIFLVLDRDPVFGKCIGRILKSCVTSTSLVLHVHLDILVIQLVEKFSQQVL